MKHVVTWDKQHQHLRLQQSVNINNSAEVNVASIMQSAHQHGLCDLE